MFLFDVAAGGPPRPLAVPKMAHATALAVSAVGPAAAIAYDDGSIVLWDVAADTQRAAWTLPATKAVRLALVEGDTALLAGAESGAIFRCDSNTPSQVAEVDRLPSAIAGLAAAAHGKPFAALSRNEGSLHLDGKLLSPFPIPGSNFPGGFTAVSAEGRWLAAGQAPGRVTVWNIAERIPERELPWSHSAAASCGAFSADGKLFAAGAAAGGAVVVWATADWAELTRLQAALDGSDPVAEIRALAFAPDGRTLAVATAKTLQLWDVSAIAASAP
jgi:WD40 repeat protein